MASETTMDQRTIEEARERMRAQLGGRQRGKKGSARIAPRVIPAEKGEGDRLRAALKKMNLASIGAIEEVVLHKSDNTALHFSNPKVSLDPRSNLTAITGNYEVKKAGHIPEFLQKFKEQLNVQHLAAAQKAEGDEEIPDLVKDFEAVADEADAAAAEDKKKTDEKQQLEEVD